MIGGKLGVLLVNLGTPNAPTAGAVRRYLGEFLWDRRVVSIPRPLWWLILNGVILRLRPPVVARKYAKVWLEGGSPLLVYTLAQAEALQARFAAEARPVTVLPAMRYGEPSIASALTRLRDQNVDRVLVLSMYPQYSSTTTAAVLDAVAGALASELRVPELRFVNDYFDDAGYISALADSVRESWAANGRAERLLFSFHGLPQRLVKAGDPYRDHCLETAGRLAEALGLRDDEWLTAFQSRFGREEWLRPYTDETLRAWGQGGTASVDVLCPGFPADCLETLEEVAMENRDVFLEAGGQAYRYIPALNAGPQHIRALHDIAARHLAGF